MNPVTRRQFIANSIALPTAALATESLCGAEDLEHMPWTFPAGKVEHVIMVWLGGGSCQIDTWDPKRLGDAKSRTAGSYYSPIDTAIAGTQLCEHLPRCANILDRFNILRTVHHEIIDEHAVATNIMHTGRKTTGTITYPSIGSAVSYHQPAASEKAPPYVLIGYPNVTRGPGFLGSKAGFMYLTETAEGPAGLNRSPDVNDQRQRRREALLAQVRRDFLARDTSQAIAQYDETISQALKLAGPQFMSAFELDKEPAVLRNAYGGEFGQRCLLSRRLIQRGVRFIEVSHNLNFVNGTGWDTHDEGQLNQHILIQELDHALATLVTDLEQKKFLDKTLIVVASEFGRPAGFDAGGGRGHHSKCFSVALAGGGLNNGVTVGTSDELGMKIVDRPISIADLHATIHWSMGTNPRKLMYAGDRPVPTTDQGTPVKELFV